MEGDKNRRADSESKTFKKQWTSLYFFVEHKNKPTCLICKEAVTLKESYIRHHYETKHKKEYGLIIGRLRDEKILTLRRDIESSRKSELGKKPETEAALKASYQIAHTLTKQRRLFSDGECVGKCMIAAVEEICPQNKNAFQSIDLSSTTITKRVEDLEKNLQSKLKKKAKNFEMFSIALDESTDVYENIQLLVFIRGISCSFEVTEELAAMRCMRSTTTSEEIFDEVEKIITDHGLSWSKLTGVTTNGDVTMVGCPNGMSARISKKVLQSSSTQPLQLHSIIHELDLCNRSLGLSHVIKFVINIVRYITTGALSHKVFRDFIADMESDYEDFILCENKVYWLSKRKMFKRFFDLRNDINVLMTEISKPVAQLKDPSWIWDLALLCDIMTHLNEFTKKQQKKNKLISELYEDVMAFQANVQLFIEEATKSSLDHFPTCASLFRDEKLASFFPKSRIVQILTLLKDNFTERFIEINTLKSSIRLFENPFAVDVPTAPVDLQLELIDLQSQTSLFDKFRILKPVEFYALLPPQSFPKLRKIALRLTSLFASTHLCTEVFSMMKRSNHVLPDGLTKDFDTVLRVGTSSLEPDIDKLASKKGSKHHSSDNVKNRT